MLPLSACVGKCEGPDANPEEVWVCKEIPLFFHYTGGSFYGKAYYGSEKCDIRLHCCKASMGEMDFLGSEKSILSVEFKAVDDNQKTILLGQNANLLEQDHQELTVFRFYVDDVQWIDGWPVPYDNSDIEWTVEAL